MKTLLKNGREAKGFTTRQVSETLGIDQALISKYENGLRTPTLKQLLAFAALYDIEPDTLRLIWLKEKILREISGEPLALEAIRAAESELSGTAAVVQLPDQFKRLLTEMESLKTLLGKKG